MEQSIGQGSTKTQVEDDIRFSHNASPKVGEIERKGSCFEAAGVDCASREEVRALLDRPEGD